MAAERAAVAVAVGLLTGLEEEVRRRTARCDVCPAGGSFLEAPAAAGALAAPRFAPVNDEGSSLRCLLVGVALAALAAC
jgi:hypothetical protein